MTEKIKNRIIDSRKFEKIPLEILRDRDLLVYEDYDEYIDDKIPSKLVEYLSYRAIDIFDRGNQGFTLSKKEFRKRSQIAQKFLKPMKCTKRIASLEISTWYDPLLKELARREEANIDGRMLTIIYLRDLNKIGHEISSFIDFRHRVCTEDWELIFLGKIKIKIRKDDLSYYNWRNHKVISTDSPNFEIISAKNPGTFKILCVHDRRKIVIDPKKLIQVKRYHIPTHYHLQATLYDHIITKNIDLHGRLQPQTHFTGSMNT